MKIPTLILRQLYTFGSLAHSATGARFSFKNRLSDATVTSVKRVAFDEEDVDLAKLTLIVDGHPVKASAVSLLEPLSFPLKKTIVVEAPGVKLTAGKHKVSIAFNSEPFGDLSFSVEDSLASDSPRAETLPYDKEANQTPEIIRARQDFLAKKTGVALSHVPHYSIDPGTTRGNVENFTGVAQVPIGFAGPLLVNGEHAQGEFFIPLATTEGTLVASYNRGMKTLNLAGGVTCTVVDDCMQRAPVFVFDSAREARDFRDWVNAHLDEVTREAEATSNVAKLLFIDTYLVNKFAFLRFNYSTGDAAGQNMVGRATFAACSLDPRAG